MSSISEMKWDVVVIGAGMAGLTASVYLARAGRKVLLLEKAVEPGGRAATKNIAGSWMNLGPHALYKTALGILQEVGVTPTGAMPKPNSLLIYKQPKGGDIALPLFQFLLGSFLKWSEKTQLIRFYAQMRKEDTSILQNVSLEKYLETRLPSPRVRNAVLALIRTSTYCSAPDLLSAGAAIVQLQHGQVLYVDGGWRTLVDPLKEQALAAGVTIRCGCPVRTITGNVPEMSVSLKDGVLLKAHQVLSTVGPKETLALLDPALQPEDAAIFEQLVPIQAACLDLVMTEMPNPKTTFAMGADYPWYFSNHSAIAKFSDNPKQMVVHVMKYLRPGEDSNSKQDEHELEQFLDLIQPRWRLHVVQRRFLPHLLVSHAVVDAASGGYAGRPGPVVKGRKGLFVAGDWVGAEGMLLGASLASAKSAAHCIINGKDHSKEGNSLGA
ncbi:phytoene desaturase family protein [Paenibacillus agricola]|uniref:NAD(P)/FAD-dependent oxidoreductase n=1 Tax=Paenibacillus agricola TaxID=2716264 RepID=A0ABX0JDI6_9BACL|nr:FAD-dependent oxidoreductase [Paenibacillus agricola]NHN34499.1 NAD(P)/FAD-dependent oxidoreductase [Paenibacillus agricola]